MKVKLTMLPGLFKALTRPCSCNNAGFTCTQFPVAWEGKGIPWACEAGLPLLAGGKSALTVDKLLSPNHLPLCAPQRDLWGINHILWVGGDLGNKNCSVLVSQAQGTIWNLDGKQLSFFFKNSSVEVYFTYLPIQTLKYTLGSFVAYFQSSRFCDHCHGQILSFIPPSPRSSPTLPSYTIVNQLPVSMDLPIPRLSHKWVPRLCHLLWLASFT